MKGLALYAEVCRSLLQFNSLDDPDTQAWSEAVRKLKRLRLVLQCRVCKSIRKDPYGSGGCNHITCRDCKETKKGYFSGCRHCKNPAELKLDKQTIAVLKCYAKVCEIFEGYRLTGGNSVRNERLDKIWDIISEGSCLFEKQDRTGNAFKSKNTQFEESHNYPANAAGLPSQESDVVRVPSENKVVQDGDTFKDGRRIQDVAVEKCENELNSCTKDEKSESNGEHFQSGEKILTNASIGLRTKLQKNSENLTQLTDLEEKVPKLSAKKEKDSKHFKFVSNSVNHEVDLEGKCVQQKNLENVGISTAEKKNGHVHNKILPNGTEQIKNRKRPLSPVRSSHEDASPEKKEKNARSCGNQELKKYHNNFKVEENKVDGKVSHHKRTQFCNVKALECQESKKNLVTKQSDDYVKDEEHHTNKKTKIDNGHRQYNFLRKNKYKCSCGTSSGMKHFADICNHKRCVCFAAGVPCVSCKCQFCSNPHKSHYSVKWSSIGIENETKTIKLEQTNDN